MKPSRHIILAIILSATLLVFANTLAFGFINWDDDKYVLLNPRIRDMSVAGIGAIFTSLDLKLYTPLTTLSFAVDFGLWGLNPAGYHAVNLLLHLLNTWLVFRFCLRFTGGIVAAAVAAALFGVHPLHVESVAWISERKDLLFTFFTLGSMLLYARYRQHPGKGIILAASIFVFLCSLLAKPQAVAMPVILLLMDYFHDGRFDLRRSLGRIWPFAALAALFSGLALYFATVTGAGEVYPVYAWWNRPFLAAYGICFYIVKLILPFNLTAFYEWPRETTGILPLGYYLSAFGMGLLAWAACRAWKRRKDLAFGILFFLLILLPVIQVVRQFGPVIVAEHYAYLSSVGIFLIAGRVVAENIKNYPVFRYLWGAAAILVILGFAALTYERNKVWANSLTLFTDIISKNPRIALAYNNRGIVRFQEGDLTGAGEDYNEAIRLNPRYVKALINRGGLRAQAGDLRGALSDYNMALALNPACADAHYNRGLLFDFKGEPDRALRDLAQAILSNPEFAQAYAARGRIKAEGGRPAQALADFKKALQLNPADAATYFNMAKVYFALTNEAAARLCFENASKLGLRPGQSVPAKPWSPTAPPEAGKYMK